MPMVGRCWALQGEQPKAVIKPGYSNFYTYSAISPTTGESFSLFLPEVNTEMMNLYLAQLSQAYPQAEITLVLDQAGWHRSKALVVPKNIKLEYLPAYSPELNPVERLWRYLRRHFCRNRFFSNLEELARTLEKAFLSLSQAFLASLCCCSYL